MLNLTLREKFGMQYFAYTHTIICSYHGGGSSLYDVNEESAPNLLSMSFQDDVTFPYLSMSFYHFRYYIATLHFIITIISICLNIILYSSLLIPSILYLDVMNDFSMKYIVY